MERAIDSFLNDLGAFLHYTPYCTSFFIFVVMSKAFRLELKRWAHRPCGRELTVVHGAGEEDPHHEHRDTVAVEIPTIVVNTIALSS